MSDVIYACECEGFKLHFGIDIDDQDLRELHYTTCPYCKTPFRASGQVKARKRDGEWMDEWGCCRVCGGEIPHGHSNGCDIYKMEQRITTAKQALRRISEHHQPATVIAREALEAIKEPNV